MENPINNIIMPQIPESLRTPKDSERYFVELERILVEMFGGDQAVVGDLEIGGNLIVNGSATITGELIIGGLTVGTTRVTTSPYNVLPTDNNIFCDTDSLAIILNLPIGTDGKNYRIINTGDSDNDVTVVPNGSELLTGENASRTLSDGSVIILTYETTEGWW